MRDQFKAAETYFCPQGHNAFTTTERSPECGACGNPMTTDPASFDDAIEIVERRGIRQGEGAPAADETAKGWKVAPPAP